jgi:hypothetical protein
VLLVDWWKKDKDGKLLMLLRSMNYLLKKKVNELMNE